MSLHEEKKISFTSVHQCWKALESINSFSVRCLVPNLLMGLFHVQQGKVSGEKKSQSKSNFQLAQIQKCDGLLVSVHER